MFLSCFFGRRPISLSILRSCHFFFLENFFGATTTSSITSSIGRTKKEVLILKFSFKIMMMMMIWIIPFRVLFILLIAAWCYRVPSLEIWQCKGQLSDFSSPQNDAHSLEWGYLQSSKELSKGDKNLALWFNAYDKWNTKAFFTKGQHIKKISFALWLKFRMIILHLPSRFTQNAAAKSPFCHFSTILILNEIECLVTLFEW